MASNDMRMRIHIEGDNKGFRQALNQTQRDIDKFQRGSNLGFTDLLAAQAAPKLGGVLMNKMLSARNAFSGLQLRHIEAINKRANNLQAASAVFARNGDLRAAMRLNQQGIDERLANRSRIQRAQSFYNKTESVIPFIAGALKGTAVAGAVAAAAAAAVYKLGTAQSQQLKSATQFSAGVTREQAMLDVKELKYQMEMARNPFLMDQQKRLLDAQYNNKMAGGAGIGYITTEAQILWNDIVAGIKEIYGSVTGASDITSKGVVY